MGVTLFSFTDGIQKLNNTNSTASILVGTSSTPDPVTGLEALTYWNISFWQLVCSTCGAGGSSISNGIVTVADQPSSGPEYTWSGGYKWHFNPPSGTYNEDYGVIAGQAAGQVNPGQWTITNTPEPPSLMLLGTGLILAVLAMRRRLRPVSRG